MIIIAGQLAREINEIMASNAVKESGQGLLKEDEKPDKLTQ